MTQATSAILTAVLILSFLRIRAQFEVLRALDGFHTFGFTLRALKLQNDFLCGFRLLLEDRFRLPTIAGLFLVVPPLPLRTQGCFACLVLRYFVRRMLLALTAICVSGLRDVDHSSNT